MRCQSVEQDDVEKRMRVLQINSVCGVGSTGKICQDLYWELKRRGYECKIAWGRRKGGNVPDEDTIQIGKPIDYYWHALSTRIFDNTGFCSKRATEKFIEEVKIYNPDVIHLHNIHGYYINISVLFNYLRQCGKKIIWTLHDCWSFTGHCTYMDFIGCNKWKSECFNCPQKKDYPKSYLFDQSRLNYNEKKKIFTNIPNLYIVTPSYWLAGLVKESFLRDYPVSVIHNGIDTNIFKPTPSDIRSKYHLEERKIILSVANQWNKRKGYDDLLRLSNKLASNYILVIIGVTEQQKGRMNSLNNVVGITRTENQKRLAEWYSIANVFINLTYEDNYPTVNLESQACGTPVISYSTGGCVESVPVNNLIKKGDLKSLILLLGQVNELYKPQTKKQMVDSYIKLI